MTSHEADRYVSNSGIEYMSQRLTDVGLKMREIPTVRLGTSAHKLSTPYSLAEAVEAAASSHGDQSVVTGILAIRGVTARDLCGRLTPAVLRKAENAFAGPVSATELEAVFGPQWEDLLSLVRITAELSPERVARFVVDPSKTEPQWRSLVRSLAHSSSAPAVLTFRQFQGSSQAARNAAVVALRRCQKPNSNDVLYASSYMAGMLCLVHRVETDELFRQTYDQLTRPWRDTVGGDLRVRTIRLDEVSACEESDLQEKQLMV